MKNITFKVGDEIICIKDHTNKLVRNGEVFYVLGFTRSVCCGRSLVDVGLKDPNKCKTCNACQCMFENFDGCYWLEARLFRKIANTQSTIQEELPEKIQTRIHNYKKTIKQE